MRFPSVFGLVLPAWYGGKVASMPLSCDRRLVRNRAEAEPIIRSGRRRGNRNGVEVWAEPGLNGSSGRFRQAHLTAGGTRPSFPPGLLWNQRCPGKDHSNAFTSSPLLYQSSRPMREKCVFALRRNKHQTLLL